MHFRLNLASRVYLDRRSVRRWLLLLGGLLALLLAVNLLYAWRNLQQLRQVDGQLSEVESQLAARRDTTTVAYTPESFARVMSEVDAANKIIEADQYRWSELLGKLETMLPDGVAIRSLKPNFKDRSLQIAAVARDTEAMTALLDVLLESTDMHEVQLLNQVPEERSGQEPVISFSLVIRRAF